MAETKGKGKAGASAPADPPADPPTDTPEPNAPPEETPADTAGDTPTGDTEVIPMGWLAMGTDIDHGRWYGGTFIGYPGLNKTLDALGAEEGENAIIVPLPQEMVETTPGRNVVTRPVKGKLPPLHLAASGDWGAYKAAHPPKAIHVSKSGWKSTIHLPE